MTSNRTKNSARNALAGVLNRIVGLVIPFALRTALIKVLGEEYLGLSNLFSSILQVLNLADLGFSVAITYSMYKPIAEGDDYLICALLNLYRKIYICIGAIISVVGICISPFLEYLIKGGYPKELNISVLYFIYLFNTVCGYLFFAHRKSLMAAFQRSDIENNINTVVQLLLDLTKIILLFLLKNYYIYVFFVPMTTFMSGMITALISYKKYPQYKCRGRLDRKMTSDIVRRVGALSIQRFGNTISTSLDSIVISAYIGLAAVAIYGNYFYIVSSLISFAWVCLSSTTASLGNSFVTESIERNYSVFKKINMLNQWVISWCVPCLLCLYQHFMKIWVGEALMESDILVYCMIAFFYVAETRKVVIVFKDANGMWWADKWKPLVGCIVNLSFNIISIRYIGMVGVIVSTILSYSLVELPWETHVLFKNCFHFSEKEYYIDLLKYLMVTVLNSFVSYFACSIVPDVGIIFFVIKAVICIAVSNMIFVGFFRKTDEFMDLKNLVFQKISRH